MFTARTNVATFLQAFPDISSRKISLAVATFNQLKQEGEALREDDCDDSFKADAVQNFFPRTCCDKHKKHDKREPGLSKEEFNVLKSFVSVAKLIVATMPNRSTNSAAKG